MVESGSSTWEATEKGLPCLVCILACEGCWGPPSFGCADMICYLKINSASAWRRPWMCPFNERINDKSRQQFMAVTYWPIGQACWLPAGTPATFCFLFAILTLYGHLLTCMTIYYIHISPTFEPDWSFIFYRLIDCRVDFLAASLYSPRCVVDKLVVCIKGLKLIVHLFIFICIPLSSLCVCACVRASLLFAVCSAESGRGCVQQLLIMSSFVKGKRYF